MVTFLVKWLCKKTQFIHVCNNLLQTLLRSLKDV